MGSGMRGALEASIGAIRPRAQAISRAGGRR
jgi:hypothetical protein